MQDRLSMRRGLGRAPSFSVGWHDAIFEHYRILDAAAVEARLPDGIALDRHADGDAYLSVVSFRMHDMRWRRRLRLPWCHTYPQINVRVYVRSADKLGVFFLRNHVGNRLAAWAGRHLYGLPYVHREVRVDAHDGRLACAARLRDGLTQRVEGTRGARLTGHEADPLTLRYFLCERYPLFSVRRGRTCEAAMLHAPWQLHVLEGPTRTHACLVDLDLMDAVAPLPEVHCSPGVDTLMWRPYVLGAMPALEERLDVPAARSWPDVLDPPLDAPRSAAPPSSPRPAPAHQASSCSA